MATATQVGSLLVQLSMDSAQFQREATKAQSKTAAIAKAFEVTSKDVYDASQRMGVSVSQFGRQMTNLVAQMNPAAQASANYAREVTMLREALRIGAITGQQYGRAMVEAAARMKTFHTQTALTAAQVGKSTGSMQAGMQQLNYQIGDMATMWAMGARPQQIFVSQASQVVQAISLMSGGAGKFATFMAGPWGMALQAGVIVLSSIIPALLDTEKAMDDVRFASNAMGDAQGILGDVMDLTTGKIKTQNTALIALARAQLTVAKLQSQERARASQATINNSNVATLQSSTYTGTGTGGYGLSNDRFGKVGAAAVAERFKRGEINADQAVQWLSRLQKQGRITAEVLTELAAAYANLGVENANQQTYQQGLDALDGKGLGSLAKPEKASKTRKAAAGKSANQIDADYQDQLSRLTIERLNLEADYTQSIEQRYTAQLAEIDDDLAAYKRNVGLNEDLTAERRQALISAAETNAQIKRDMVETERQQDLDSKALDLKMTDLQIMMDQVGLHRDLSLSTAEQRAADLELLDLQDQLKLAQLDRIMATQAAGTAAWDNARAERNALLATANQRRQLVERRNMGPLQQYAFGLQESVANINDAMEGIRVDGIDGMVEGLAAAAAGTQKLGDVFANVAQRIIADLVRIQLQKAILGTLGNALGLVGSGTSIASDSSTLNTFGAGFGISLAGKRANGGPVRAGLPYLVGERGPEIVVPGASGSVIPNHELGASSARTTTYVLQGNLMTPEFWQQIRAGDVQAAQAGGEIGMRRSAYRNSRRVA